MGFIDYIVGNSFRDEKAGRVVVFTGDRRNRGYLVKSASDELKIKSFLKMFYFAHLSILLLGMLVDYGWSTFIINTGSIGRPAEHLPQAIAIFLAIYCVFVGAPYFFLWRSYKKERQNFVSAQDEVSVPPLHAGRQIWILIAMFVALVLVAVAILFLTRHK